MNKIFTGLVAAALSFGIVGSSMQTAEAGKRERRIAAGIGLGILGAAIIADSVRKDRKHRKRYKHHRAHRYDQHRYRKYRQRHYSNSYDDYDDYDDYQPRRVYPPSKRRVYNDAPRLQLSAAHKGWCSGHYRSYRVWDNSFQPYHGPRRSCNSPYN